MKIREWLKKQINESIEMKRAKCNYAREKRLYKVMAVFDRSVDQYMARTKEIDRAKAEKEVYQLFVLGNLFSKIR